MRETRRWKTWGRGLGGSDDEGAGAGGHGTSQEKATGWAGKWSSRAPCNVMVIKCEGRSCLFPGEDDGDVDLKEGQASREGLPEGLRSGGGTMRNGAFVVGNWGANRLRWAFSSSPPLDGEHRNARQSLSTKVSCLAKRPLPARGRPCLMPASRITNR